MMSQTPPVDRFPASASYVDTSGRRFSHVFPCFQFVNSFFNSLCISTNSYRKDIHISKQPCLYSGDASFACGRVNYFPVFFFSPN